MLREMIVGVTGVGIREMRNVKPVDFKMLAYIKKNPKINLEKLSAKSKSFSFSRVNSLLDAGLIETEYCIVGEWAPGCMPPFQAPSYILTITGVGEKELEDYLRDVKDERLKMWIKNAWMPIFASVLTTLAINVLQWLWPSLTVWATSFLQKTS